MFVPLFIFRSFPFLASFLFSFQIFVSLSCISSLSCPLYTPSSRLSGDETSSTSDPSDLLLFLIPWTPPALLFSSWEARSLFVLSAAWKFPPDPWCSQAVVWFQISALVSRSYFLFTTFLPGTPVCSFSLQLIFSHIDWFTLFHFMESTTTTSLLCDSTFLLQQTCMNITNGECRHSTRLAEGCFVRRYFTFHGISHTFSYAAVHYETIDHSNKCFCIVRVDVWVCSLGLQGS